MRGMPKTFKQAYEAIIDDAKISPDQVAHIKSLVESEQNFAGQLISKNKISGSFGFEQLAELSTLHFVWILMTVERHWDKEGFNQDAAPQEGFLQSRLTFENVAER